MAANRNSKIRSFEIPKEFIGTFFTQLEGTDLNYSLEEIDEDENLLIEMEYTTDERDEVMNLIELLDDYLEEQKEDEDDDNKN